jgi:hypothetical protein
MMNNQNKQHFIMEIAKGWTILGIGIILDIFGLWGSYYFSFANPNGRLMVLPGIFITAWGAGILGKYILAGSDPETAKKLQISEKDERLIYVKSRAGYDAFYLSIPANVIGLLVYTYLTRNNTGLDIFWFYLVFLVAIPVVVYFIRLIKYDNMN